MVDGEVIFDKDLHCYYGSPDSHTWFNLKVVVYVVSSNIPRVSVYLDGVMVLHGQHPNFPTTMRAGVLVPVGYNNVVFFKNLEITAAM